MLTTRQTIGTVLLERLHGLGLRHMQRLGRQRSAVREFDAALPSFQSALREDDLLFITADHGNDPTTPSTDHARECVPLLALGPRVSGVTIGRRETFADLGATVAEWFGVPFTGAGTSFLGTLLAA